MNKSFFLKYKRAFSVTDGELETKQDSKSNVLGWVGWLQLRLERL